MCRNPSTTTTGRASRLGSRLGTFAILAFVLIGLGSTAAEAGRVGERASLRASALRAFGVRQAAVDAGGVPPATARLLAAAERRFQGPNAARFASWHPHFMPLLRLESRIRAGETLVDDRGLLPTNAHWNALRLRRSLNPTRFDHWHPRLGAVMALDGRVRNLMARSSEGPPIEIDPGVIAPLGPLLSNGQVSGAPKGGQPGGILTLGGLTPGTGIGSSPASPGGGGELGPGPGPVAPVPEPGAWILMSLGLAAGVAWRRLEARRRRA